MTQIHPLKFFALLKWLDGRPLLEVMEPYRQQIHSEFLYTFRPDGWPQFKRGLKGRGKKNSKTADEVLAALYKLLAWESAGHKGNQVFFVASDLGQANDDLDLCKKLITVNPVLAHELEVYRNVVERKDGKGFIEILPAGDAPGLHGKTYLFLVVDELHTQKDYRLLEALELDRTRPDAVQSFASYAAVSPSPGVPINDILKQHSAQSDPRLFVSWYSGTIEEANPSLNGPIGPTIEDILDAQRSLPSWVFRRLYQNLPGQPDNAAFNADVVQSCVVLGRTVLPPQPRVTYSAFCDLSGGGADDSTLAIAHHDRGRTVLDCLIDQGPRRSGHTFSPQVTVERFAQVLKEYGCSAVTGDRYAGEWPRQAFEKVGIVYRVADRTRSQLYAALEPLLNSSQAELLYQPKLLNQLIGLIRKGEKIAHGSGEHDDHANAAAGALGLAAVERIPLIFYSGGKAIGGLINTIAETITDTVTSVKESLASAGNALVPEPERPPTPLPHPNHVRSIAEIESLAPGCRAPFEQAKLDEHYGKQPKARSDFERSVLDDPSGVWWPDGVVRRPILNLEDEFARVRVTFDQWTRRDGVR